MNENLLDDDVANALEDDTPHLYTGDEVVDAPEDCGRDSEDENKLPEDGGPVHA